MRPIGPRRCATPRADIYSGRWGSCTSAGSHPPPSAGACCFSSHGIRAIWMHPDSVRMRNGWGPSKKICSRAGGASSGPTIIGWPTVIAARRPTGRRVPRESGRALRARSALLGGGSVYDHLLEHLEIVQIAAAAEGGDAAHRVGPAAIVILRDIHQLGILQHEQVPVEITVGQRAKFLQF